LMTGSSRSRARRAFPDIFRHRDQGRARDTQSQPRRGLAGR
jgi:hypothetical protein